MGKLHLLKLPYDPTQKAAFNDQILDLFIHTIYCSNLFEAADSCAHLTMYW